MRPDDITERERADARLTTSEVANVMKPLETASVLPLRAYSNRAYYEQEVDAVIRPGWHAVGRVSQLSETGSYITTDIAGEPVIVIRGKDGVLRAMSNVCRHRGAQLATDCGVAKLLVCPYHTWTYNLDGSLRGAPHMNKVDDFSAKAIALPQFALETWNGFVFVNLDPNAAPLAPQVTELTEALAPFNLEAWEWEPWVEFDVDWNWKISLENFSEAYHHIGVHKDSIGKVSPAEKAVYEKTNNNYSLFYVYIEGEDGEYLPDSTGYPFPNVPGLPEKFFIYSPVANIYPDFHMVMGPNFVLWLRFEISGAERHKMIWSWIIPPGAHAFPDFDERIEALKAMMTPIVHEDLDFMPRIKACVTSRAFDPGRYSDQERAVHQMHQWLIERMATVQGQSAADA